MDWLPNVLIVLCVAHLSSGQYYLEEKACGSLHSEENFGGQQISFLNRDQSINLQDDPRAEAGNWSMTASIQIESSCSMELCNETYFDGGCQVLNQGQYPVLNLTVGNVVSVGCTCMKECKCSDIYMKKTSCARAYLEGGCATCHTPYVDMEETSKLAAKDLPKLFPEDFVDKVQALRLRKGCTLTLYKAEESNEDDDEEDEGRLIDAEIVENFKGQIGSYECTCDDSKFTPREKPERPKSFPPLVEIPNTLDDVIKMLRNEKYSDHPGWKAALQSLKTGRSSKNAYIMLLGSTGSGKSSAINLLFDNPNVTKVGAEKSTTTDIHEFRIPVAIDELGVANSELRVIDTPGLGDTRGLEQDAMFLATLDDYISSHEELKDRIPNVVLIFHKFHDNRFNGKGSAFVRMLRGLDSFRTRITDENYSNVIFVLSHFCSVTKKDKRRPESRLAAFKTTIEDFSQFPRPTIITVAENRPRDNDLPMVNGFAKLPNNEYYPRNLFEKLELVTEKGGDPIGLGVFRTAFRDSDDFNITSSDFKLLPNKNDKVLYYLGILSNALIGVVNTEISKLLKHNWDEKLDAELKRKFPESLPYLQKALNMRNINTKDDVPKTATAILDLLTAIKHDEATRTLMEKALGIKPPVFPQDTVAGFGYNVFKDTYLPTSPFVMGELQQSVIGYMIPKILTCNLDPGNKEYFHLFDTKDDYITHRIQSLGISGTISNGSFSGVLKPGHNIKSISFRNDSCSITASREIRLFEFQVNDRLDLTPEFAETVRALPQFNESDHETVEAWNKFFNDYGTHVVQSVYGGGAIEIELESDKPFDGKISQALFDLIKFAEDMSFLIVREDSDGGGKSGNSSRGVIDKGISHSLKFVGGDAAYHTTDLTQMSIGNAAKLLTNWKKSLKHQPAVLTTEMRLVPIGQIAKKLGQNYSSEIERATSLLFDSSLKYKPPKRRSSNANNEPGLARDNTPLMTEFAKQMAETNTMIQNLMMQLQKQQAEREKRQQEMEMKRMEWEKEQKERDLEFKREQLALQQKTEAEKRAWQERMEEARRKEEEDRRRRNEEYNKEIMKMQEDSNKRMAEIMKQIADKPAPSSGGGCLKPGTMISMADGSEKMVEELTVGDIVIDMDLKPSKVLGVNFNLLLDMKFYGFDNQSYFFTDEHMFIGPRRESRREFQFYVKSRESLLRNNPLMKFWDVKEMGDEEGVLQLFHRNGSKLGTKNVAVFEDPKRYAPETPVYFIQVDSPSGTYIANGYVCKVDVPPIERWPNTMSLLFNLMETPAFQEISKRKYSLDTVFFVEYMISEISEAVNAVLTDSKIWKVDFENNLELMTLDDVNVEECLHKVFNDPTAGLLALRFYARFGNIISPNLDSGELDYEQTAFMQRLLYEVINLELQRFVENIPNL